MDLPVDVVYHIFYFLGPCDIVRLRRVSRQFHEITRNSALWRKIYANAGLLLPPGPFSSQSTRYLERTLVQSELVSRAWTSKPLNVFRQTKISWKGPEEGGSCTVAFGRWCLFLKGKTIQCHDIDTDTCHSLYDGINDPMFSFSACTAADGKDHWVYLLLVGTTSQKLIRLLGFRVYDDGFSEAEIIEWTHNELLLTHRWQSTKNHHDFHGSTPFLVVQHYQPCLVLDLRTRCLHKLSPKFSGNRPNESRPFPTPTLRPCNMSVHIVLTKTHVIAFWAYVPSLNTPVLIQAFVAPESMTPSDENELCLTHEVEVAHDSLQSVTLLRNSIVDPVTGSVNVRLLRTSMTSTSCLDLTLPASVSAGDVLPISILTQPLFETEWSSIRYTASDDGHARGFLLAYSTYNVRKFAIDASGKTCTVALGDAYPVCPSWHQLVRVAFCGTRGRAHFVKREAVRRVSESRLSVFTVDFV